MDRKAELQRLSEADRHICDAERHVSHQLRMLEQLRHEGHDTELAERTLSGFETALETLRQHRHEIVRTIEQIDRGLM